MHWTRSFIRIQGMLEIWTQRRSGWAVERDRGGGGGGGREREKESTNALAVISRYMQYEQEVGLVRICQKVCFFSQARVTSSETL